MKMSQAREAQGGVAAFTLPDRSTSSQYHSSEGVDQALESAVEDLLSFTGSEYLLRAANLDVLMKGMGRIFSSSKGTEATYSLSAIAGSIEYFVSHNWTVPRILKFVALAFKFNLNDAFVAAIITIVICLVTGMLRWQPPFELEGYEYETDIGCRLLLPSVVLFVLLFGRVFHFRASGPSVFLDKVCIHQVDQSLQRLGIHKLGAFIRSSDRMLVLYTSIYCRRLWTVYEVASFLTMHDVKQLEFVPVMLPLAYVVTLGGQIWYNLIMIGIQVLGLPGILANLSSVFGALFYYIAMRLWAKSRAEIRFTLQNFSVFEAECAVEGDRQIVFSNIIALMKASKRVKRNVSDTTALEAFNNCVRKDLAEQFDEIFGKFAFSPAEYILLCLATFGPTYVDSWCWLAQGAPFREVLAYHLLDVFYTFTFLNALFLITEIMTSHLLHLNWWREMLWCSLTMMIVAVIPASGRYVASAACERAETDDVLMAILLVGQVFTTASTWWLLPKVCSQHRRNSSRHAARPPLALGQNTTSTIASLELSPKKEEDEDENNMEKGLGRGCDNDYGIDCDCEFASDANFSLTDDFTLNDPMAQVSAI